MFGLGKKASYPVPGQPDTRRSYLSKELLYTPAEGVDTVADVLPYIVSVSHDTHLAHHMETDVEHLLEHRSSSMESESECIQDKWNIS